MHGANDPLTPRGFWDERTGWRVLKQVMFLEPLPGGSRWAAAFGSLLLFAFALQVGTGILLAMNYAPSVDSAWESVNFIQHEVPLGGFTRAVHHWGSSAMVILLLLHVVQVFVWGAYKPPREFTWVVGVLLLFCTLGLAFTGYLLPWDQKAYWATKVGLGIVSTVPVVGDDLRALLQGGEQMGNLTLTRFFTVHAFLLPGLLILLVVVHLYLFRVHGVTPPWWESAQQLKSEEEPFWPKQVLKDAIAWLAFLALLGWWCLGHAAPLEDQADPSQPYEARPEWYFMFFFQLLRHFEGPYEVVGTFVLPLAFCLLMLFWPFLDRNPRRNPIRRPVSMGLFVAGTAGLLGLTYYAIATDVRMTEPARVITKAASSAAEPAGPIQRADVARIYDENCAACHGVDGHGEQVRPGMPAIPDFVSLAWQMSQTDLEITHGIQEGKGAQMPAYRDKLSPEQILALTVYLRAFAINPHDASRPVAADEAPAAPVEAQMSEVQVYRAYCLACHDADGRGTTTRQAMPDMPDFTDRNWQTSRTDAQLTHSIEQGKGQMMLPMKDKLGADDAERLVSYVRAFAGGEQVVPAEPQVSFVAPVSHPAPALPEANARQPTEPARVEPAPQTALRTGRAAGLYRQYCLSCHSADGRGFEMKGAMPAIPDFANRSWQQAADDSRLAAGILDGKGTLMPAFRGRITDEGAQDLVAYVRAFGPARGVTPARPPASDFEVRFRELQEQWNELHRQFEKASKGGR
jgi:ubiquinol-cytochrome c reductase cytochrome b subunit